MNKEIHAEGYTASPDDCHVRPAVAGAMMDTQTIDTLFLELSQVTKATTAT